MIRFLKSNWWYIIGSILVLGLFSLRLFHITIIPVFVDEAIYIRWAQVMRAVETLRFLPLSDGKQPLFMWLIIPLFKFISDPLVAGRLVSVFAGLGTLIGITILSYLLFRNKAVSLAAAIIYTVSPFTFFFDRMALADSLLSMFGVWTFIFALIAIRKMRLDFAMIAGFALGGAWLTKSPALFYALMLPGLWLFADWKKGFKNTLNLLIRLTGLSLVTVAIGFGMYNILRLGPNFHLIASRNLDYVYPLSHIITRPLDPLKVFFPISFKWIWMMGPWSIFLLAIGSFIVNSKKNLKEIFVLTLWFLLPIVVQSEFAKTFTARYILFSIPYLIIISASIFNIAQKKYLSVITLILAFLVAQALVFDKYLLTDPYKANLPRVERSGYLEEWTAGQGIKETADYLTYEHVTNPSEKIVVGTEGYFGTLPDGLQIYLNNQPEITVIGVGLGFDTLPSQLVNSKKAGDKTYLVVNASRFHNSADKLGLKLINSYPKAVKPNGTQDSLLLFEVTNEALKIKTGS